MQTIEVNKFVIMADRKSNVDGVPIENEETKRIANKTWGITPKHLRKINGETLIARTSRLLKERGITNIIITSHDERYEIDGVTRYEPKGNTYWVDAYTEELITEPIVFLHGDCFYSEEAIDTIISSYTEDILFFGSDIRKNKSEFYFKNYDEPFGVKIVDIDTFKKKRKEIRELANKENWERCISWELYRYINGLNLHKHIIGNGYVAINDITTDIDNPKDIDKLENILKRIEQSKPIDVLYKRGERTMITLKAIMNYSDYSPRKVEVNGNKPIILHDANNKEYCAIKVGDMLKTEKDRANELMNRKDGKKIVELIAIEEPKEEFVPPIKEEIVETAQAKPINVEKAIVTKTTKAKRKTTKK